jgi:hypothetical protein
VPGEKPRDITTPGRNGWQANLANRTERHTEGCQTWRSKPHRSSATLNSMSIPWRLALKAIPWDTILANAPAILRSTEALLSETKARPPAAASRNDMQALSDRVAVLEQRDRETAELLTRISTQIAALTTAGEVLQARARWLLLIAIAAFTMSAVSCGAALFAR